MRKIIGIRLEEERERLHKNKGEMAVIGGVSGSAYTNYSEGERAPDAEFLAAIAAAGADVNYILTGIRANHLAEQSHGYSPLTREEAALLDNFRHTDKGDQAAIKRMALLAANAAKEEKKQKAWNGIDRRKGKGI